MRRWRHMGVVFVVLASGAPQAPAGSPENECVKYLPEIGRSVRIPCVDAEQPSRPAIEQREPAAPSAPPQRAAVPLTTAGDQALKPGMSFKDCSECPEMVVIPAGTLRMGSPPGDIRRDADEGPQRDVTIAAPFAVGKFEVTVDEFAAFMAGSEYVFEERCFTTEQGDYQQRPRRSFRNPGFSKTPVPGNYPAACLQWEDVKAYTDWLSKHTGKPYRLLTEAEWEYAARAGTTSSYYFGDEPDRLCEFGNVADLSIKELLPKTLSSECKDGHPYASAVGSFAANSFGLHDMMGNVAEWVEDCWHKSYEGAPADGSAWTAKTEGNLCLNLTRGGSWEGFHGSLRSADRAIETTRKWNLGFRVARPLSR